MFPIDWIGPDGQPRIGALRLHLGRIDAYASVEGNDLKLVGEQGIDVELLHRRTIHHQLRQAHQDVGDCRRKRQEAGSR